jgi:hypothetical protein
MMRQQVLYSGPQSRILAAGFHQISIAIRFGEIYRCVE